MNPAALLFYVLTLDQALTTGDAGRPWKPLTVRLGVQDSRVVAAAATGWNGHPQQVDFSGLTVTNGAIWGALGLTLTADPWYPKDGRTRAAAYLVAGTYDVDVAGMTGRDHRFLGTTTTAAPPPPQQCMAFLRLHKAMQHDGPVVLLLALHRDGPVRCFSERI